MAQRLERLALLVACYPLNQFPQKWSEKNGFILKNLYICKRTSNKPEAPKPPICSLYLTKAMENLVDKVMKRFDAPHIAAQLQSALQDEAQRRRNFREWLDEGVKAEFINGEVLLHSPVRKAHLDVTRFLGSALHIFSLLQNRGTVWTEKAMIALTRNDYEPDIVFFGQEKSAQFEKNQMLFPAPDFVVEILSKKTSAKDRGVKKEDYAAHGIGEYWIVDPERQRVEQYLLLQPTDRTYFEPYIYTIDETIESRMVAGFIIPVRAIFEAEANAAALKNLMA